MSLIKNCIPNIPHLLSPCSVWNIDIDHSSSDHLSSIIWQAGQQMSLIVTQAILDKQHLQMIWSMQLLLEENCQCNLTVLFSVSASPFFLLLWLGGANTNGGQYMCLYTLLAWSWGRKHIRILLLSFSGYHLPWHPLTSNICLHMKLGQSQSRSWRCCWNCLVSLLECRLTCKAASEDDWIWTLDLVSWILRIVLVSCFHLQWS